jgi:hypothetical protein
MAYLPICRDAFHNPDFNIDDETALAHREDSPMHTRVYEEAKEEFEGTRTELSPDLIEALIASENHVYVEEPEA